MLPKPLAAALSCAMLLGACTTYSSKAVPRMPDASLLLPCQDPALVDDPETATDNEVAAERIRVAEAYLACRQRHADLVTFVRGVRPERDYYFLRDATARPAGVSSRLWTGLPLAWSQPRCTACATAPSTSSLFITWISSATRLKATQSSGRACTMS